MKLRILALSLCLPGVCAAQVSGPSAAVSASVTEAGKASGEAESPKVRAEEKEKEAAALRADLAAPWISVSIALAYDGSCTGPEYRGFCLERSGVLVTVAPWVEEKGLKRTGAARPLTPPQLEKLLSEAALFYLAASRSVAPIEKTGPMPRDPAKVRAWAERFLAAGGSMTGSDEVSMEVRVGTLDGWRRYNDAWGKDYCPPDFPKWIAAFGTVP